MATKTITIMADAYERLAREKQANESFSDTIRRIIKPKKSIMDFAGVWDKEFAEEVEKNILENRKRNKARQKWRENMFA